MWSLAPAVHSYCHLCHVHAQPLSVPEVAPAQKQLTKHQKSSQSSISCSPIGRLAQRTRSYCDTPSQFGDFDTNKYCAPSLSQLSMCGRSTPDSDYRRHHPGHCSVTTTMMASVEHNWMRVSANLQWPQRSPRPPGAGSCPEASFRVILAQPATLPPSPLRWDDGHDEHRDSTTRNPAQLHLIFFTGRS